MYKSIIPASDWYFAHKQVRDTDPPIVWNLAAWGMKEDGEIIGLVGAFGAEQSKAGKIPHLVSVPPVPGAYLHLSQLTEIELQQAKKR